MHVVPYTGLLHKYARKRIDYLSGLLPTAYITPTRGLDRVVAHVTVELLSTWANFSRALYLSSCVGARDGTGKKISTLMPLADTQDAITQAVWRFRPHLSGTRQAWTHREEPGWTDPNQLSILLNLVGASNSIDVDAALSFQQRALTDLPRVRNFYAHRNADTARKALGIATTYGVAFPAHPTEVCLAFAPGRTRSVLADWLSEVRLLTELATS